MAKKLPIYPFDMNEDTPYWELQTLAATTKEISFFYLDLSKMSPLQYAVFFRFASDLLQMGKFGIPDHYPHLGIDGFITVSWEMEVSVIAENLLCFTFKRITY